MKSIVPLCLPALVLALPAPVLAEPVELECALHSDQFDSEEPLSVNRYTLNRDASSVNVRTNTMEMFETCRAFYAMKPSTTVIDVVSWLEMPGEVINLMRLVNLGDNSWSYEPDDPGDRAERIHMAR